MEPALGQSYLQPPMGFFGRATSPWRQILFESDGSIGRAGSSPENSKKQCK